MPEATGISNSLYLMRLRFCWGSFHSPQPTGWRPVRTNTGLGVKPNERDRRNMGGYVALANNALMLSAWAEHSLGRRFARSRRLILAGESIVVRRSTC